MVETVSKLVTPWQNKLKNPKTKKNFTSEINGAGLFVQETSRRRSRE